ncbi:MAG: hypothetical protein RIQ94_386 [Pseudomonadota bacterium]|jgi:hypothetical protein
MSTNTGLYWSNKTPFQVTVNRLYKASYSNIMAGQRTYQGKINISLECLHFLTDYQYKARNFQLITIDNSNMYRIWVGVPIFSSPLPTIITTGQLWPRY